MTDDLVKRLRAVVPTVYDAHDAADEIERLQARVDELEKDLGCADAYQREWEQHCKTAEARVAELEKKDCEAATHVESVIAMRTGFTGDPPYVGWRGLGLALNEALDARDAAEARAEELEANINIKADFIDATINQLSASDQHIEELESKLAECEARLEKAVVLLGQWRLASVGHVSVRSVIDKHDATLAELTGGKDE